jgi:hypothetical protein
MWLDVALPDSRILNVSCVYRQPSCTLEELQQWFNSVSAQINIALRKVIMMGDFNVPYIDWSIPVVTFPDLLHEWFLQRVLELGLS